MFEGKCAVLKIFQKSIYTPLLLSKKIFSNFSQRAVLLATLVNKLFKSKDKISDFIIYNTILCFVAIVP